MTATATSRVLLFAVFVDIHFQVLASSIGSCHCFSCSNVNEPGECLNRTACESIDAGSSTPGTNHTEWHTVSIATFTSPRFYSCNENCSTVNRTLSDCETNSSTTLATLISPPRVVEVICAVLPLVVVLLLVLLLVYCQLRRMQRRKKVPLKMLPEVQDMDASVRRAPVAVLPEDQQAISRDQSTGSGVSGVKLDFVEIPCSPTSSLKASQSFRQIKEDWTPRGISKSGSSTDETPRRSPVFFATSGRAVYKAQPAYENVRTSDEERDHIYRNVDLESPESDDDEDSYIDCPDYVNTNGRKAADGNDLTTHGDVNSTTSARVTTPVTSNASLQRNNSPHSSTLQHQSAEGVTLTSSGKAVSSDWLTSIRADKAAPMDSDYIDMNNVKSKRKTELTPKSKKDHAAMFVSVPDVRTTHRKNQHTNPVYENQIDLPEVSRKPKTSVNY